MSKLTASAQYPVPLKDPTIAANVLYISRYFN